jgi:hypothetical protein
MPQFYQSGKEVQLGDRVRLAGQEGKIIALESQLPDYGMSPEKAKGMVMIETKSAGLYCDYTDTNEDLDFLGRAER